MRGAPVALSLLAGAWLAGGAAAAACRDDVVDLRWDGGSARFTVEVADDSEEQAKGLMFRESLPASAGMIFIYDPPRRVAFWMKNTLIPLDMIFVGPDGRVLQVHPMAVPGDETAIPGPADTRAVIEINGGLAATLGIAPGAEVRHPAFDPDIAAWPCS